jgi:hypothetical protein
MDVAVVKHAQRSGHTWQRKNCEAFDDKGSARLQVMESYRLVFIVAMHSILCVEGGEDGLDC